MNALAANREALRLRDEQHLTYEAIARTMRDKFGYARSPGAWGNRLRPTPRPSAPVPDLNFTEAYRASLAVGYDPLEALDAIQECESCGHLPCVCRRAVA